MNTKSYLHKDTSHSSSGLWLVIGWTTICCWLILSKCSILSLYTHTHTHTCTHTHTYTRYNAKQIRKDETSTFHPTQPTLPPPPPPPPHPSGFSPGPGRWKPWLWYFWSSWWKTSPQPQRLRRPCWLTNRTRSVGSSGFRWSRARGECVCVCRGGGGGWVVMVYSGNPSWVDNNEVSYLAQRLLMYRN